MAFNPLEWLKVARAVDRLLGLEAKHTALLEAQAQEIQALKDRVAKLEAREAILIAEAKGAAPAALAGFRRLSRVVTHNTSSRKFWPIQNSLTQTLSRKRERGHCSTGKANNAPSPSGRGPR